MYTMYPLFKGAWPVFSRLKSRLGHWDNNRLLGYDCPHWGLITDRGTTPLHPTTSAPLDDAYLGTIYYYDTGHLFVVDVDVAQI